jgi:hypothetical protein
MNARIGVCVSQSVKLACWLVLAAPCGTWVYAQSLRDPTRAPLTEATAAPGTAQSVPTVQSGGMAVLVRQGVPYLVVGTRLYAKGQMVGLARIERISETEVWLREAGAVRKVPVFGGIQRQASNPASPKQSSSSPSVAQSKPRGPSP